MLAHIWVSGLGSSDRRLDRNQGNARHTHIAPNSMPTSGIQLHPILPLITVIKQRIFREKASQPGLCDVMTSPRERGLREVSVRSNVGASSSNWRNGWQTFSADDDICSSSVPTIIQERERERNIRKGF